MKKIILILSLACLTLSNISFAQQGLDQTSLPSGHRMATDHDMEVYSNDLFVVLEDGSSGIYGALYKYDGSALTQITLPAGHRMASGYDMEVYGNDLFVVLEDGSSGIYGALYKYDGSALIQITLPAGHRMAMDQPTGSFDCRLQIVLEDGSSGIYGALYKYASAYTCVNLIEITCDLYTSPAGVIYNSSSIINEVICREIYSIELTINNVSDLTTTTSGITISANNLGATYQWLDCDNSNAIILGETGQSFTPTANGNYAVELTENGCVDTTSCVSISTLGIIENDFGNGFVVYPNPTIGNFAVDLGDIYETSYVSIADVNGKLIYSKSTSQSQILNLSIEEATGIYIVSIYAGNKKAVIRLIKK